MGSKQRWSDFPGFECPMALEVSCGWRPTYGSGRTIWRGAVLGVQRKWAVHPTVFAVRCGSCSGWKLPFDRDQDRWDGRLLGWHLELWTLHRYKCRRFADRWQSNWATGENSRTGPYGSYAGRRRLQQIRRSQRKWRSRLLARRDRCICRASTSRPSNLGRHGKRSYSGSEGKWRGGVLGRRYLFTMLWVYRGDLCDFGGRR